MPIEFDCPHCGESLSFWDELAGKQGSCPKCREAIAVPGLGADMTMACPKCEAEIPASSVICTNCGVDLKRGLKLATRIDEPDAGVGQTARESVGGLVDALWRHKFIIAALVIFFSLMMWLFHRASTRSIAPVRSIMREMPQ